MIKQVQMSDGDLGTASECDLCHGDVWMAVDLSIREMRTNGIPFETYATGYLCSACRGTIVSVVPVADALLNV